MMSAGFVLNVFADQAHHHGTKRNVPAGEPNISLQLEAIKDKSSGYNLLLKPMNFRFSPERAGEDTDAVEGHAHLYVNGRKISRVYGNWVHVPDDILVARTNLVIVTLITNTHENWVQNDRQVEAVIDLEGQKKSRIDQEVHLYLKNNSAKATVIDGVEGQIVRFHIMGIPGQNIHLHGYDVDRKLGADGNTILIIKLEHTGRFPMVIHMKDDLLGHKEKAFAYVEVRSR